MFRCRCKSMMKIGRGGLVQQVTGEVMWELGAGSRSVTIGRD